jgi:hypothetical protein
MNDWSDAALAKLKKQEQDQQLKNQALVERQRLKKAYGTPLWHEVRRIVKENCDHLNKKAGEELVRFSITPNTEIEVLEVGVGKSRSIHATFNEDTGVLEWKTRAKSGSWEVLISDDGSACFAEAALSYNPASIANQMMDAMLFD